MACRIPLCRAGSCGAAHGLTYVREGCEHMFVRWDNLTVEAEEHRSLPGHRDPATVRRFDAPEALDMRFYEVQARSVLNRVPEKSRMPFRWTVNPYRGCSHACTYCMSGDTRVLMADGRTIKMADLQVGDAIYGTCREGRYRRFVPTRVLDKWSSVKPAYAVTLEDGTELVASADHRFLSARGWKHVTGAEHGPRRRPHLTPGSEADRSGRLRLPAGRRRRLQARVPVRDDPWGRASRLIRARPARPRAREGPSLPPCARGSRGPRAVQRLSRAPWSADERVPVRGSQREPARRTGDPHSAPRARHTDSGADRVAD